MAFDIRFLSEFLPGSTVGDAAVLGEITLGNEVEGFQSLIGFWSPLDYEHQWVKAVQRLVEERQDSCLITSLDNPRDEEIVWWWLLYPDGNVVHVQHAMLLPEDQDRFSTAHPYAAIPDRVTNAGEAPVSEWDVPFGDFKVFLGRNP